jgi:hypothetical protein
LDRDHSTCFKQPLPFYDAFAADMVTLKSFVDLALQKRHADREVNALKENRSFSNSVILSGARRKVFFLREGSPGLSFSRRGSLPPRSGQDDDAFF